MPKIDKCFIFVCQDTGPDDEGIPSFEAGAMSLPMVCATQSQADMMSNIAESMAKNLGKHVELRVFEGDYKVLKTWMPE